MELAFPTFLGNAQIAGLLDNGLLLLANWLLIAAKGAAPQGRGGLRLASRRPLNWREGASNSASASMSATVCQSRCCDPVARDALLAGEPLIWLAWQI
jgi:hypothetical protein